MHLGGCSHFWESGWQGSPSGTEVLASGQGRNWVEHHLDTQGSGPGLFYRQKGLYSVLTAPVTLHSMWLEVGVRAEAEEIQTLRNSVPEHGVSENKLEQGTAELLSGLNAQCVYNSGGCGKHALRPQQFLSESWTQCRVCKIPVRVSSRGLFCYPDGGLGL